MRLILHFYLSYFSRCSCHQYSSPPGLRDSVRSSLQDCEGALITHADQTTDREFQDHSAFEGSEIPDILQDEEFRSVVIAVGEIIHDEGILEG